MRAIRRICLVPLILATAATIAAGPGHAGDHVAQASNRIAAYYCPTGSSWDNVLIRCI